MNKTISKVFNLKLILTIFIAFVFVSNLLISEKATYITLLFLMTVFFSFVISKVINHKKIVIILLFLMAFLPVQIGEDFGFFVLKSQRVIILLVFIFWLLNKHNCCKYIFPLKKIYLIIGVLMLSFTFFTKYVFSSFLSGIAIVIEQFIFSFLIFSIFSTRKYRRKLVFVVLISTSILSILGIIEYFTSYNFYHVFKPFREVMAYTINSRERLGGVRISGPLGHPIAFGILLCLGNLFNLFYYSLAKKRIYKLLCFLCFSLITLAVLLTGSRSVYFFYLITLLIILFNYNKKFFIFFSLIVLLISSLSLVLFAKNQMLINFIQIFKSTFNPFVGSHEMLASAKARIDQLILCLDLISKSPLIGYGRTDFGLASIDNFYIVSALTYGIPVLILFIFLFIKVALFSFFVFKNSKDKGDSVLGLISFGTFVGLFFIWFTNSLTSYFYLIWILLGLTLSAYVEVKKECSQ